MDKKFFCVFICLILFVGIFAGCKGKPDPNVMMVREGTLDMNPGVPVGKAFDQFFANGKWESFTSTEGKTVVEFNGKCQWYNQPADFRIQFDVKGERFEIWYVSLNDQQLNIIEGIGVVGKVLSEYRP